jgi:hypothetical protein
VTFTVELFKLTTSLVIIFFVQYVARALPDTFCVSVGSDRIASCHLTSLDTPPSSLTPVACVAIVSQES